MARRIRASSGGSSHNGGGPAGLIGGRIGVRKSFLWQYFSSIRSVTHGGTGMGVKIPIDKGHAPQQPESNVGAASAAISSSLRNFLIPSPSCPRRHGAGREVRAGFAGLLG